MKQAKVSIIMPVYNKEKYIEESINSVLRQTYKDYELIIINDGSTDGSKKIIDSYVEKNKQIYAYHQTNSGVSASRNKGLEMATGEYICFLDADDYYLENFLEEMYENVKGHTVIYCGNYNKKENNLIKSNMSFKRGDIVDKYLKNKCIPNTNSWMIKLSYIKKHKIKFPTNFALGEDMVFFSKVLFYESNVLVVPKYLTIYNSVVTNSLTFNIKNLINEDIEWMEYLKTYFLTATESKEEKKRAVRVVQAINCYRLPACVIFKVNLQKNDKYINRKIFREYDYILKNMRFINGLRSIKLMAYYLKLKYFER